MASRSLHRIIVASRSSSSMPAVRTVVAWEDFCQVTFAEPELNGGCSSHYAWVPVEGSPRHQDQLMLMLPGHMQRPHQFKITQRIAGYAGYRVLGLDYKNRIGSGDFSRSFRAGCCWSERWLDGTDRD